MNSSTNGVAEADRLYANISQYFTPRMPPLDMTNGSVKAYFDISQILDVNEKEGKVTFRTHMFYKPAEEIRITSEYARAELLKSMIVKLLFYSHSFRPF